MAENQQGMYDRKYTDEVWSLAKPRPDAFSTTRYDDTARLLATEEPGGKMLEIGCGSGKLTMALAEQFDKTVGIDLSEVRIETANKMLRIHCPHLVDKMEFTAGDGDQRLPFDDASFDAVLLCAVIEHVVNPFVLMDDVARVCKPGGCLVLSTPNICYLKHIVDLLRGLVPTTGSPTREIAYWREHGWDGGHLHYFSKQSLDALLRHCGFKPEVWTGDGKWAKLRRWHTNLVGNLTVRARRVGS